MRGPEHYRGREQTYLKHFFLENYLERAAYNIGSFASEFVYVDGFSGPWRAEGEAYEDTSFDIAINKLQKVRAGLADAGKSVRMRCLFVEENPTRYQALSAAIASVEGMEVKAFPGSFEDNVPQLVQEVGRSFALVFIDPTGWTGLSLPKIKPLLNLHCDVLVNFMFDYINRFPDALRKLCGLDGPDLTGVTNREQVIVDFYTDQFKSAGRFKFASHTRIYKPEFDRTYFYLVYGTGHRKGLYEFRKVEKQMFPAQRAVRSTAKQRKRVARTKQSEMFTGTALTSRSAEDHDRSAALAMLEIRLRTYLRNIDRALYDDLLSHLLQTPFVWESDVKEVLKASLKRGELRFEGLAEKEKVPKFGKRHFIVRSDAEES